MTITDKPKSKNQKYITLEKGKALLEKTRIMVPKNKTSS